jgi:DNA-binding CsgD family transcriptional regulator
MISNIFLKLHKILNSQDEDALIYDVNTSKILLANKKVCQSLGFDLNEIVNLHIDRIISKNFNPIIFKKTNGNLSEELRQFVTKCGYSFIIGIKNKKISIKNKKYQLISFRYLPNSAGTSSTDKKANTSYINFSEKLFQINHQVTNVKEDMFFKNMVYSLANAFQVRWVMICLFSSNKKEARVLSLWDKSNFHSKLTYKLEGTPCAIINKTKEPFYCEKNVTKLFPEDFMAHQWGVESYVAQPIISKTGKVLGLCGVMDDKPIKYKESVEYLATMQYFSGRIAKEIVLNNFKITKPKKDTSNNLIGLTPKDIPLTKRESQVLNHVCSGLTSNSIAEQLAVSLSTVKFHLKNIYNKLGVNGRNGLLKSLNNRA